MRKKTPTMAIKSRKDTELKRRRNQVAAAILSASLRIEEFSWKKQLSFDTNGFLIHVPTQEYFNFYGKRLWGHKTIVDIVWTEPGEGGKTNAPKESNYVTSPVRHDWARRYEYFEKWLVDLKKWTDELSADSYTPDLWSTVTLQNNLMFGSGHGDAYADTHFSTDERVLIRQGLSELQEFIVTTQELTEKQLTHLGQEMDYIRVAAERVSRRDWRGLLLSILISLIIQGTFDRSRANELFLMTHRLFEWIRHETRLGRESSKVTTPKDSLREMNVSGATSEMQTEE